MKKKTKIILILTLFTVAALAAAGVVMLDKSRIINGVSGSSIETLDKEAALIGEDQNINPLVNSAQQINKSGENIFLLRILLSYNNNRPCEKKSVKTSPTVVK